MSSQVLTVNCLLLEFFEIKCFLLRTASFQVTVLTFQEFPHFIMVLISIQRTLFYFSLFLSGIFFSWTTLPITFLDSKSTLWVFFPLQMERHRIHNTVKINVFISGKPLIHKIRLLLGHDFLKQSTLHFAQEICRHKFGNVTLWRTFLLMQIGQSHGGNFKTKFGLVLKVRCLQ